MINSKVRQIIVRLAVVIIGIQNLSAAEHPQFGYMKPVENPPVPMTKDTLRVLLKGDYFFNNRNMIEVGSWSDSEIGNIRNLEGDFVVRVSPSKREKCRYLVKIINYDDGSSDITDVYLKLNNGRLVQNVTDTWLCELICGEI